MNESIELDISRGNSSSNNNNDLNDFSSQKVPQVKQLKSLLSKKLNTKVIVRSLTCPVDGCNKTLKNRTDLKLHLKNAHRIDDYRCLLCTKSYKTK